jgi:hypothetical protein
MDGGHFLAVMFLQLLHGAMVIGAEAGDDGFSVRLGTAVSPGELLCELNVLCRKPIDLIFPLGDFRLDRGQVIRKALEFIVGQVDLLLHAVLEPFDLPFENRIHRGLQTFMFADFNVKRSEISSFRINH